METQKNLDSKTVKILIPFVIILGIIVLVKSGFAFGQWLYVINH